jgi:hypothetical protein
MIKRKGQYEGFFLVRNDARKKFTRKSGTSNKFILSRCTLILDFEAESIDEEGSDDIYTLFSIDPNWSYKQSKTLKADKTKGESSLKLVFTDIAPSLDYSLRVDPGIEGYPYYLFEDVPYQKLKDRQFFNEDEEDFGSLIAEHDGKGFGANYEPEEEDMEDDGEEAEGNYAEHEDDLGEEDIDSEECE